MAPASRRAATSSQGDGCFAFYMAPGGDLRFDFFAHFVGQTNPGWHGVSSVSHPVGQPGQVTVGRWYRLRASFDALTTARLWIDGEQVAQRSGFRSAVGSPGGHGVSIGNWTLGNQFPLLGALDWLAVWKLDQDVVTRNFVERLDPDARRGWSDPSANVPVSGASSGKVDVPTAPAAPAA